MTPEQIMALAFQDELEKIAGAKEETALEVARLLRAGKYKKVRGIFSSPEVIEGTTADTLQKAINERIRSGRYSTVHGVFDPRKPPKGPEPMDIRRKIKVLT